MKNFILFGVCVLLSVQAVANKNESGEQELLGFQPSTNNKLHYLITPYAYVFGMNGTQTIQGDTKKFNTTPMDILNNLDKVDAIFQLHAELKRGPWNAFIDPVYVKLTLPIEKDGTSGTSSSTLFIFDFGIYRTLYEDFSIENPHKLQLLVAGRHFTTKGDVNLNSIINISGSQDFTTPMIGARWSKYLTPRLNVTLRGDYGGFGLDGVSRTFDVYAFLNYAFTKNWSMALAWRSMGVKFQRGVAPTQFAMNMHFWGPLIGLAYRA